ncbi:MAG: CPBP family intramembrane glutamic endopeptidase [Candidatus Micrarchaeia archaeon]
MLFIAAIILYNYSYISTLLAEVLTTALFSLLLPALSFAYLAHKGMSFSQALSNMGLIQKLSVKRIVLLGLMVFVIIFVLEIMISIWSNITSISINTNSCSIVTGMPLWFILFVALIGPLDEEIFFRGFLVKRIGIIPSALLFAVLHAGYGSTFGIDIIAALIFGLVAGYVFKKTESIYPTLIAHILVNAIAVIGCL